MSKKHRSHEKRVDRATEETLPDNPLEAADVEIARAAATQRDQPVVKAVGRFSELADQLPLFAICGATLAVGLLVRDRRLARAGLRMLAAEAAATGLKTLMKRGVERSRPHLLVDRDHYSTDVGGRTDSDHNSMPSGHTAGATAVANAVAKEFPALAPVVYTLATVVGAAQVPRARHYPSDVLMGAAIGKFAGVVVDRLMPEPRPAEEGVAA